MAYDFSRLLVYRKSIRPPQPESFPIFVDNELDKAARASAEVATALKDLDARLTAAGF